MGFCNLAILTLIPECRGAKSLASLEIGPFLDEGKELRQRRTPAVPKSGRRVCDQVQPPTPSQINTFENIRLTKIRGGRGLSAALGGDPHVEPHLGWRVAPLALSAQGRGGGAGSPWWLSLPAPRRPWGPRGAPLGRRGRSGAHLGPREGGATPPLISPSTFMNF